MRLHPARDRDIVEGQVLPLLRAAALQAYPDLAFDDSRALGWLFGFQVPGGAAELHWFAPGILIALRKEPFSVTRATLWRAQVFAAPGVETGPVLSGVLAGRAEPVCILSADRAPGEFLGHQYRLAPSR